MGNRNEFRSANKKPKGMRTKAWNKKNGAVEEETQDQENVQKW